MLWEAQKSSIVNTRLLARSRRRARGRGGLALLRVVAQGVDELGEDGRGVVGLQRAAAGLGSLGRDGSGLSDHCVVVCGVRVRRDGHDGESSCSAVV